MTVSQPTYDFSVEFLPIRFLLSKGSTNRAATRSMKLKAVIGANGVRLVYFLGWRLPLLLRLFFRLAFLRVNRSSSVKSLSEPLGTFRNLIVARDHQPKTPQRITKGTTAALHHGRVHPQHQTSVSLSEILSRSGSLS